MFMDHAPQNLSLWVHDKLKTLEAIRIANGDTFGHAETKCTIAGGHKVRELPSFYDDQCHMFETVTHTRRRTHLYYYG